MRFICWLWRGRGFWKRVATYGPQHVAVLASMLERHGGHRLTCIHDGSFEMPAGVDAITMPPAVAALPDYLPKLWAWSPALHDLIGERFTSIDLDVVILGDLAPVLDSPATVRLWNSAIGEPYNTSLFTIEPGHGQEVWTEFSPAAVKAASESANRWTGDQSWVAHVLGPSMPTFGEDRGVLRYRKSQHRHDMPHGTLAAFFCGPMAPDTESEHSQWVMDNWR
jgi:hypothetical protein